MYISYYTNYKNDFKITQVNLDKLNTDLLLEKYPIIISDKIVKPQDLLKTSFAYSFNIQDNMPIIFHDKPIINLSKFMLLYNQITDIDLNIIHPKNKNKLIFGSYKQYNGTSQNKCYKLKYCNKNLHELDNIGYTTVKLKKDQVLILPTYWIFHAFFPIQIISLDDFISYPVKNILNIIMG